MAGRAGHQPQLARRAAFLPLCHGAALPSPGQRAAAQARQAAGHAGFHHGFQLRHAGLSLCGGRTRHRGHLAVARHSGHCSGRLFQLHGGRTGQLHSQGAERQRFCALFPDPAAALFDYSGPGRTSFARSGRRAAPFRPHGRAGPARAGHADSPGPAPANAGNARTGRRQSFGPRSLAGRKPLWPVFCLYGLSELQHYDRAGHLFHERSLRGNGRAAGLVFLHLYGNYHSGPAVRQPPPGHSAPLPDNHALLRGADLLHAGTGLGAALGLHSPDLRLRSGTGPALSPAGRRRVRPFHAHHPLHQFQCHDGHF